MGKYGNTIVITIFGISYSIWYINNSKYSKYSTIGDPLPNSWMVYDRKKHLYMDDYWGYPYFRKHAYLYI